MHSNAKQTAIWSQMAGAGLLFVASVALLPTISTHAEARSHICVKIESELAAYSSGRVVNGEKRTNKALAKRMKLLGCSPKPSFFGPRQHKACPTLRGQKRASDRRLARAQSDRGKKQLERLYRRNSCGTATAETQKPGSLLERLFGKTRSAPLAERKVVVLGREPQQNRKRIPIERKKSIGLREETPPDKKLKRTSISSYANSPVRSLCVRTCDGYAFPVSYSTRTKHLEKDAEACANLCPGREMKLYFHRAKNESMAQSISYAEGTDYAALPRAFAFKQKFDPNCSCNHRIVKREAPQVATPLFTKKQAKAKAKKPTFQLVSTTGKPSWRPSLSAVPTEAQAGEDDVEVLATEATAPDETPKPRRVRVIGEEFLPDR